MKRVSYNIIRVPRTQFSWELSQKIRSAMQRGGNTMGRFSSLCAELEISLVGESERGVLVGICGEDNIRGKAHESLSNYTCQRANAAIKIALLLAQNREIRPYLPRTAPDMISMLGGIFRALNTSSETQRILLDSDGEFPAYRVDRVLEAINDSFTVGARDVAISLVDRPFYRVDRNTIRYCLGPERPGTVALDRRNSIEMVRVPGGVVRFNTGFEVVESVEAFYCGRFPITNAQWRFFGTRANRFSADWWKDPEFGSENSGKPVVGIDFYGVEAFCGWSGLRMPTNAEWQRAALGDSGGKYPWGDAAPQPRVHGNFGLTSTTTTEVGEYPAGKGPYGHFDMFGNVWEWVNNVNDERGGGWAPRMLARGGSFLETMSALDDMGTGFGPPISHPGADYCNSNFGFRVAISASEVKV